MRVPTRAQQEVSLRAHAEKKALAGLLRADAATLELAINFSGVRGLPRAYMKGASRVLDCRIFVREPLASRTSSRAAR